MPLHTLRSSTFLAAVTMPSKHLEMIGMTFRSTSAKLRYVSPSFTVRRSSISCRFCGRTHAHVRHAELYSLAAAHSKGAASDEIRYSGRVKRYLEDLWDGHIEVLPLLCVEVLQLSSILVLALVCHVGSHIQLGLGLEKRTSFELC